MQPFELPFDPKEAREQFDVANHEAQRIHGQNIRYVGIGEIEDAEIFQVAHEGLVSEQSRTIGMLQRQVQLTPYEELARAEMELSDRIGQATKALEQSAEKLQPAIERIDRDEALARELSPTVAGKVTELAVQKKRDLEIAETGIDRRDLRNWQHKLDMIEDLYHHAGGAQWEVPQIIQDEQLARQKTEREAAESLVVQVGGLVVGQSTGEQPAVQDPFEAFLQRNNVETPGAAHHIAFQILEKQGGTVSVSELAQMLTDRKLTIEGTEGQVRNRVTALMSKTASQGMKIARLLQAEGYVLQYGRLTVYGQDGETVVEKPRRVYRAVPADDPEAAINQEFEVAGTIQLSEAHSVETVAATGQSSEAEAEKSWQEALTDRVHKAIADLEADGLMKQSFVSVDVLRMKSSSGIMGTRKAIQKMARARLLEASAERNPDSEVFTPTHLVQMSVLNATEQLRRRNTAAQREAVQIITHLVQEYFDRQKAVETTGH